MARLKPRASGHSTVDLTRDLMAPPEVVIKAILDGVDEHARQMERKWGVGRLRLLVSDSLRIRFDAQQAKLDAAVATNEPAYISAQAEGMRRARRALDVAATEAGAQPLAPEVWDCVLPSTGEVVSIVRTENEAHHVARQSEIWTLAEVAVLIERLGNGVRRVKRTFPGAAVVAVRGRSAPPIDWEKGDDLPLEERMATTFPAGPCRHS